MWTSQSRASTRIPGAGHRPFGALFMRAPPLRGYVDRIHRELLSVLHHGWAAPISSATKSAADWTASSLLVLGLNSNALMSRRAVSLSDHATAMTLRHSRTHRPRG